MTSAKWQPSVFLNGDIAGQVTKIKQQQGPDLHVWGSGILIQTLIKHDLVDTFWLMIYPITLGLGKRLFADGTIPMAFKVTESTVTPSGVIVVNYERAGALAMHGVASITSGSEEPTRRVGREKAGIGRHISFSLRCMVTGFNSK